MGKGGEIYAQLDVLSGLSQDPKIIPFRVSNFRMGEDEGENEAAARDTRRGRIYASFFHFFFRRSFGLGGKGKREEREEDQSVTPSPTNPLVVVLGGLRLGLPPGPPCP